MYKFSAKIEKYVLSVNTSTNNYKRRILCYGSLNELAYLYFVPDDLPLSENKKIEGTTRNKVNLYYRMSDWDAIVDILRNEKPVWVTLNTLNIGYLKTAQEEVGEEEA